jgi:bifunctional DNA-binding transcriptional regulator/antitoxin component of YhaV-PrlF toxin-antitoxin module
MRKRYTTSLTSASKRTGSLRTTIPITFVDFMGLEPGDTLIWDINFEKENIYLIARKLGSSVERTEEEKKKDDEEKIAAETEAALTKFYQTKRPVHPGEKITSEEMMPKEIMEKIDDKEKKLSRELTLKEIMEILDEKEKELFKELTPKEIEKIKKWAAKPEGDYGGTKYVDANGNVIKEVDSRGYLVKRDSEGNIIGREKQK